MGDDFINYLEQNFQLQNKNIIVTGAANGIGREIAKKVTLSGANIILLDKDIELLSYEQELKSLGGNVTSVLVDLSDSHAMDIAINKVIHSVKTIDVLINDAGINYVSDFADLKWDKCSEIIEINLKGTLYILHKILPLMRDNGGGKIINIASRTASSPMRNNTVYAATKNSILALTRQIAIENAQFQIYCNAISPGLIKTNMNKNTRDNEKALNAFLSRQSIKRLGEPRDIANMVLFLLSDLSSFITGQEFIVDGGYF